MSAQNFIKLKGAYPKAVVMGKDIAAAIWAAFWLLVLTNGEPDLLDAVVAFIGRLP